MTPMHRAARSAVALFAALPIAATARTRELPVYDIEAYCEAVSQAVGGSYQIKVACIKEEREAKDAARKAGPQEARIEAYCADVGKAVGGSYQIYWTCVQEELEAKGKLPPR
jgi:hypothetical protein